MWERIKQHKLVAGVLVAMSGLIFIGGVFGGLDAIRKSAAWFLSKPKPEPDVKLALVNIDWPMGTDGSNKKPGQYRINLSAILANKGRDAVRARVSEATSSIAEFKADQPGGDFQELTIGPGLSVNADIDSISFPMKPGQYLEGRIDWKVKYGPAAGEASETMKISGSLGIRLRQQKVFVTWTPDADSERPTGMVAKSATYDPGTGKSPAESVTDVEASKTEK